MPSNNGIDWIRFPKRMAIYHRDGFRCMWCQQEHATDGYGLTLDHLHKGTDHGQHNLVTCCHRCNSTRQDKPLDVWLSKVSALFWQPQEVVALRVLLALAKPLNMDEGRRLAAERRPSHRRAQQQAEADGYQRAFDQGAGAQLAAGEAALKRADELLKQHEVPELHPSRVYVNFRRIEM